MLPNSRAVPTANICKAEFMNINYSYNALWINCIQLCAAHFKTFFILQTGYFMLYQNWSIGKLEEREKKIIAALMHSNLIKTLLPCTWKQQSISFSRLSTFHLHYFNPLWMLNLWCLLFITNIFRSWCDLHKQVCVSGRLAGWLSVWLDWNQNCDWLRRQFLAVVLA